MQQVGFTSPFILHPLTFTLILKRLPLRIFPADVARCHARDQKPLRAIQNSEPKEIGVEKNPGRQKKAAREAWAVAACDHFPRRQVSVELDAGAVFLERSAGVVEYFARQRLNGPGGDHRLVHVCALPAATAAVEEAKLVVRIPPRVQNPSP